MLFLCLLQGCLSSSERNEQIGASEAVRLKSSFPYMKMEDPKDCGVIAELQCLTYLGLSVNYKNVKEMMGWHQTIGNLTDTTWHHSRLLKKLNIPHKIRLKDNQIEILESLKRDKPVIVLVKSGTLAWHWIVITGFDGKNWILSWGDGIERQTTIEHFSKMYAKISIIYE